MPSGAIYIFGGVLQTITFFMEWILGNTFSSMVFAFFGQTISTYFGGLSELMSFS
jgi:succinate-acetate transporter protein